MSAWAVEPAYHDRSLADVVPAVGVALGVLDEPPGSQPAGLMLPDAPSYVVFLVDGLGSDLLAAHAGTAPYLSGLLATRGQTGTAGVPSTTATSLTSLGTALPPGAHGLVGFTSRVPGTSKLLNALQWDKDVDPLQWQPHPTAFTMLRESGAHVTVVNKREFRQSGLTIAAHRGAEYVGADRVGERIAAAAKASARSPSLTYVYDGDLDWTGHRHGVASQAWLHQLRIIDAQAEQLRAALPRHTRLLVVADHGMVDVPADNRVDVDERPDLREGVALVGGEARFRHLYCQPGATADVVSAWTALLGDRADVLTHDQAVARGWFGEVESAVSPRLGDVVVACREDFAILATASFPYETRIIGMHGSLTPVEMNIPLLVD